jgi:hypothetical protein
MLFSHSPFLLLILSIKEYKRDHGFLFVLFINIHLLFWPQMNGQQVILWFVDKFILCRNLPVTTEQRDPFTQTDIHVAERLVVLLSIASFRLHQASRATNHLALSRVDAKLFLRHLCNNDQGPGYLSLGWLIL